MRNQTATGKSVVRAFSRAAKLLIEDEQMTSCTVSAGFVIPDGQKRGERKGFQVFVKMCRFDESILIKYPCTGGLLNLHEIACGSRCKTATKRKR